MEQVVWSDRYRVARLEAGFGKEKLAATALREAQCAGRRKQKRTLVGPCALSVFARKVPGGDGGIRTLETSNC